MKVWLAKIGERSSFKVFSIRRVNTTITLLEMDRFHLDTSSVKISWHNHSSRLQNSSKYVPLCTHPPRKLQCFHPRQNCDDVTPNRRIPWLTLSEFASYFFLIYFACKHRVRACPPQTLWNIFIHTLILHNYLQHSILTYSSYYTTPTAQHLIVVAEAFAILFVNKCTVPKND